MVEGEMESSYHFLFYCPEFARLGLKHLGSHIVGEPSEVVEIDIKRIVDL